MGLLQTIIYTRVSVSSKKCLPYVIYMYQYVSINLQHSHVFIRANMSQPMVVILRLNGPYGPDSRQESYFLIKR